MNSPFDFTLPSGSLIVGWVIFGGLGTIALGLAKLREEWQPLLIGIGLLISPYFFPSGIAFWSINLSLSFLLFTYRRLF